jgi:hypothetical protein
MTMNFLSNETKVAIEDFVFKPHRDSRVLQFKKDKEGMIQDLLLKCFRAPNWTEVRSLLLF